MKIRLTGFALLFVLAMMLVCPALPAMAQDPPAGHCDEQQQDQSEQTMVCCDQQALSAKFTSVVPAVQLSGIVTVLQAIDDLTPDLRIAVPYRYWKTSEHLASLSVLRI